MAEKKSGISSDLRKSVLVIFLPLITAIITANYQYVITRWEGSDKNYRVVVSELTSKDKDKRHAAAASIGTYVKPGDRYFIESIDILTNRLSSEPNHNVRNSMIGSLKKIKNEPEYRNVIDRLLTIDRNNFIQEQQVMSQVDSSRIEAEEALSAFQQAERDFSDSKLKSDLFTLENLGKLAKEKQIEYQNLQRGYDELKANIPMVSNMISIFLSEKKGQELAKLDFFRSNMYSTVLTDLSLRDTKIKWATFASSTMADSHLINSKIGRTYFSNADIRNSRFDGSNISTTLFNDALLNNVSFVNCRFKSVVFIGSDLTGTDFTSAIGLHPEMFYQTLNLEQARFDDPTFIDRVMQVSDVDFIDYIKSSGLNNDMQKYLLPDTFS